MNDPFKTVDQDNAPVDRSDNTSWVERIGRYRLDRVLGEGGFGLVYLAYDEQLNRPVAIKVPRADRLAHAGSYLTEARTVARLDHPNIVPVYDVGSTDEFPCFIVSKYIEGTDLSVRIQQSRMPLREAVELVATVAAALHHAHQQGLFHRDIKPNNILLDHGGRPFLADFGLALDQQDVGRRSARIVGTCAYMSPEQARGEAYRVDGRSDIFSLGIVMYELLTGMRPFRGDSQELLDQIQTVDVRPLRQIDDRIPRELERVCLKALSKRPADRYATAGDMVDDLRDSLAHSLTYPPYPRRNAIAFEIEMIQTGSVAEITLSGDLDASTFDRYLETLRKLEGAAGELTELVLRMQNLNYISSAGIRALLMSKQRLGPGLTIYVIAPQEQVLDTICRTGMHDPFVILGDYPAATTA